MSRRYYVLWLVAIGLAESGAAFDVSYHFGHLFDYFSPPHMTVGVGVFLMVGLLGWALVRERKRVVGLERKALLVGAAALAVGIADEPLDLLNHLIRGIDITLWSPTHLMLNYPTDVVNVCILTALLASPAARGRGAWAIAFGLCFRNLLTMHFALYQQEYGAVALNSLLRTGNVPWYVEPGLVALAGPRATKLVTGGVPDWLYLIYFAFALTYALTLCAAVLYGQRGARAKRATDRWPWPIGAATALALCFIAWQLIFRGIFGVIHAAYPVIPWYVVPMGLVIDLALVFGPGVARRLAATRMVVLLSRGQLVVAGVAGALAALALFGGIELMRAAHLIVPTAPLAALPFACLTGAGGCLLGFWIATRVRELASASAVAQRLPQQVPAPVLASETNI